MLPASTLHSMLRVFGCLMTLIYHLHADVANDWSPKSLPGLFDSVIFDNLFFQLALPKLKRQEGKKY